MAEIKVGSMIATIDDCDYALVSMFRWRLIVHRKWGLQTYAMGRVWGQIDIQMHRLIMNAPRGVWVDHKDNNGLNNRRSNLRLCTPSQNVWNRGLLKNNTSGFKGVTRDRQSGKWMAQIVANKKHRRLGLFETPELAHEAYKKAALELHGEFAFTGNRYEETT